MNSTYQVIHAQNKQELDDAFKIRRIVFVHEQQVPEDIEIDEYENESDHFVVYDSSLRPLGAGRLRQIGNQQAKVERICIAKEFRGQGLGDQMMKKIEEVAKEKGINTLYLHAQDHAEGFYQRLGYQTISEPFDEAGIIHIKMKKEL